MNLWLTQLSACKSSIDPVPEREDSSRASSGFTELMWQRSEFTEMEAAQSDGAEYQNRGNVLEEELRNPA